MLNELPYNAVIELYLRYWERHALSSNLEPVEKVESAGGFESPLDGASGCAYTAHHIMPGKKVTVALS